MADLKTDFLNDILSESMGGKRKYKITHEDGTTEEVTIEDVSEYDQIGDEFGAGQINEISRTVNEKFDSGDVVDPMLTTKEGFPADAKLTRDAIDELNSNLSNQLELLWTNPSVTEKFEAQDVTVPDMSGYNFIIIEYGYSISNQQTAMQMASLGRTIMMMIAGTNSYGVRLATYTNDTTISFGEGRASGNSNNEYVIPYKIYGM